MVCIVYPFISIFWMHYWNIKTLPLMATYGDERFISALFQMEI